MDFDIAIPSYRRANKLREQTLAYLEKEKVNPERITVFVADEEEKRKYQDILKPGSYGRIVTGVITLAAQRNFIGRYYAEGTQLLQMDDDIKRVKFLTPRPFIQLISLLFKSCKENGAKLFSIYPVNNLFYCKERIIVGKVFCVGCIFGTINTPQRVLPAVSACEDKWRSLDYWKEDGQTLRYEGACPDTTYFAKGGLTEYRKLNQLLDTQITCDNFKNDCTLKLKKSGVWECHWRNKITKILSLPPVECNDSTQNAINSVN